MSGELVRTTTIEPDLPADIPWNLTDGETLAYLIGQNRTPITYRAIIGGRDGFVAHIPPAGLVEGSGYERIAGGILRFYNPDGSLLGDATTQMLDPQTAVEVIGRIRELTTPL